MTGLKLKILVFTICILSAINLSAQIEFRHEPPTNFHVNQPFTISLELTEMITASNVEIFYRITGEENFQINQMVQDGRNYSLEIPAEFATEQGLEYALVITLPDNSKISFPALNALENPREISPSINNYGVPILLAPDNKSYFDTQTDEILIAISLFNVTGKIKNISLKINKKEQIENSEVFEDLITLKYKDIKRGKHNIRFTYVTEDNVKQLFTWVFFVDDEKNIKKRYNYLGNVKAEVSTEKIRDYYQNISNISTSFRGSYGKTDYSSKIYMTSRENPNQQPVNRFNLNVSNSYLDFKFGDVYPSLSELSLYGNRIRGVESNLKLGFFNFQTVWGFSKRDISGLISSFPDTLENLLYYSRNNYTFSQKVLGIKPSFDFGKHVNFGLYFLKVKDDTASVAKGIEGVKLSELVNVLMPVKPQESINLGMDLNVNLDNNRTVWENEIALSELNTNIYGGSLSLEEMDTYFDGDSVKDDTITISDDNKIAIKDIPFDPESFERFFTINPHLEPLLPIVPDSLGNIGLKEVWNMPELSALSKLRLNYFKNYVIIKYKKIGTKYNSLVNPYLQKDYREFQIQDRIRFYDDRIVTKVGYTNRINNYSFEKRGQYLRNSINFGFSFYSLNALPDIEFDTYFDVRKNYIKQIDTLYTSDVDYQLSDSRVKMGTSRYNLSLKKDFRLFDRTNVIQFNVSHYKNSDLVDKRLDDYSFSEYKSMITRLSYSINLLKKSKFNASVSNNQSDFGTNNANIFNLTLNFTNMEKREKYWYYARYDLSTASGLYEFVNHKLSSNITYKFLESQSINFFLRYSFFNDKLQNKTYFDYNLNLAWYYYFK